MVRALRYFTQERAAPTSTLAAMIFPTRAILHLAVTRGMTADNAGALLVFHMKIIPTSGRTMPSGDTLSPGSSFMPDLQELRLVRWVCRSGDTLKHNPPA